MKILFKFFNENIMKNFVFEISLNAQFMNIMKQQNQNSIGKNKFEISLKFLISNFIKKNIDQKCIEN